MQKYVGQIEKDKEHFNKWLSDVNLAVNMEKRRIQAKNDLKKAKDKETKCTGANPAELQRKQEKVGALCLFTLKGQVRRKFCMARAQHCLEPSLRANYAPNAK